MTISDLPPGLVLILGALLLPFAGRVARPVLVLGLPLLTLTLVWQAADGAALVLNFLEFQLTPSRADGLSRLFATIFSIMAFAGGLFALNQRRVVELVAAFVYAGAAVGVAMAGDLLTFFVFWEIMALASTLVIWSAGGERSYRASMRYVLMHLLGGGLLMTGIAAHAADTGSLAFTAMTPGTFGTWMILAGILLNAGAPPISAWLPDAYPEASYSGTVFLSAFTTKAAVYALIRGFPGAEVLIPIGLYMVFYGIIYALLENDARRILAYSIVNQVGFMVVGVGIGTELALNGAAAHAFAHIIYKALLLMSAGAVLYATNRRKCTDLGGLFQYMPVTTICGIIGALSISAFPLTSGFISKSMINETAAVEQLMVVWFLLTAASAGVFLHAGIKYPWFVFFHKDSGLRPRDPPINMQLAMILLSGLSLGLGVWPEPLYAMLPFPVDYRPYTGPHVVNALQLLLFSGLAFFILLPQMKRTLTLSLDLDWGYRKLGWVAALMLGAVMSSAQRSMEARLRSRLRALLDGLFRHHGPQGILARTWPTGSMVLWVAVLLAAYLVFYYA